MIPNRMIAASANETLGALPLEPLRAFLARTDVPDPMRAFFAARGVDAGPAVEPADDRPVGEARGRCR